MCGLDFRFARGERYTVTVVSGNGLLLFLASETDEHTLKYYHILCKY